MNEDYIYNSKRNIDRELKIMELINSKESQEKSKYILVSLWYVAGLTIGFILGRLI